ncbi:F0F1 ATP synthase subunit delta [Actinopolymorpha sp. B9G3]|uniref:F0F1 ATP synthase subunit delta n=1 Tax=Actinopolymorpha sp. B9G3 TaxID=3158970 RepID=UPI0032D92360
MIDFRGASRDSLASTRQVVKDLPGGAGELETAGSELFAVTALLDEETALRRALTDPARTPQERARLAEELLGNRIGADAQAVVTTAVKGAWARTRDLADALEHAGVLALIRSADSAGRLDDLEDELFRFARLIENDARLAQALTGRTLPVERRVELARGLLAGKAQPSTVRLVEQAVAAPRGLALTEALDGYGKVAAAWRERLVATVRSAVPLGQADRDRLARALSRQYGHDIHLNVLLDPEVIGGLRVELGDEVIDGTIAGRLDDARRRLAG